MSDPRFNVCAPRKKKDGGTYWHRVGTAFEGEKGVTIYLDSSPYPDDEGRVVLKLFPDDGSRSGGSMSKPAARPRSNKPLAEELDDEIPF